MSDEKKEVTEETYTPSPSKFCIETTVKETDETGAHMQSEVTVEGYGRDILKALEESMQDSVIKDLILGAAESYIMKEMLARMSSLEEEAPEEEEVKEKEAE